MSNEFSMSILMKSIFIESYYENQQVTEMITRDILNSGLSCIFYKIDEGKRL